MKGGAVLQLFGAVLRVVWYFGTNGEGAQGNVIVVDVDVFVSVVDGVLALVIVVVFL